MTEKSVQLGKCDDNLETEATPDTAPVNAMETEGVPGTAPTNANNISDGKIIIDDELLIEAVRNIESLWNHSKTRMHVQTKDLWQKVCSEIGVPSEMTKEVQGRWTNLRSRYMKARKTFMAYTKSGSAAKKPKFKSQFIYFDQMSFLADVIDVPE